PIRSQIVVILGAQAACGENCNVRAAISRATLPHAATTSRSVVEMPAPCVWMNGPRTAWARCSMGKTVAMSCRNLGIWPSGTNTPEMKYSGSTARLVAGAAASAVLMRVETANAMQAKEAAPTTTAITSPGSNEEGV